MGDTISVYSIKDCDTREVWFIPKVNTDLFRDGNGLPILRREVHEYNLFNRYKAFGCDSTPEHSCPLCEALSENMCKIGDSLRQTQEKIINYDIPSDKVDEAMKTFKLHAFINVPFRKNDYVYMVVAVLDNYFKDEMKETEFIPCYKLKLVRMTVDTFNRDFRLELLASDKGVFFDVLYSNSANIIEKAKSRAVTKSNIILSSIGEFEKVVTKEFRSIHILDLTKLKPELKQTSTEEAKKIASLAAMEIDETMGKNSNFGYNFVLNIIQNQEASEV